jgi:hypothetical protein
MAEMLPSSRATRYLVLVLAFAVAFASTATCLAAVVAEKSEAPCHRSEQHPAQGSSIDCCPGDSANTQSFAPGQLTLSPSGPSPVLVAVLPVDLAPPLAVGAGVADTATGRPKPPGIATYVLVSSFRI